MRDPIESFLAEQADYGEVESVGSFTVSGERAVAKLAEFQLPRPSAWILKMVQAGVLGQAASIVIKQKSKSTSVTFDSVRLGSLEELRDIWTHPAPILSAAQKPLLIALRAVGFARRRPILVTKRTPGQASVSLFWNGLRLSAIQPAKTNILEKDLFGGTAEKDQLCFHIGSSPLGDDNRLHRTKGFNDTVAEEFRELQQHAVSCPVPLTIDGRRVDHFGMEDVSLHRKPMAFGCEPMEEAGAAGLKVGLRFFSQAGRRGLAASAWVLYKTSRHYPSQVCWVKDGVVCEVDSLSGTRGRSPFCLRLYLPADDLGTDLTGLHLIFPSPELRSERRLAALRLFQRRVQDSGSALSAPTDVHPTVRKAGEWIGPAAVLMGGTLLAPFTWGLGLVVGALGAVGLTGMAKRLEVRPKGLLIGSFRLGRPRYFLGLTGRRSTDIRTRALPVFKPLVGSVPMEGPADRKGRVRVREETHKRCSAFLGP